MVFIRTPYNYDTDTASEESGLTCKDASLTKQSFAEEADINTIVERFGITGELPQNVRMPTYMDYDGVYDFQTAMNAIIEAKNAFMAMPAKVRARFHNNAAEFVDFCSDPENREEAKRLGLLAPPQIAEGGNPAQQEKGAPAAEKPAAPAAPSGPA